MTVCRKHSRHCWCLLDISLVQVMQDVNGRFIANIAKQLRKRAVSLCVEELKEYKVIMQPADADPQLLECLLI